MTFVEAPCTVSINKEAKVWQEFMHMVSDPAHWAFEFSVGTLKDLIVFGIGAFFGKYWIRRHDKKHHNG